MCRDLPSTLCHSRPGLQSHQGHLWDLLLDLSQNHCRCLSEFVHDCHLLDHWDRLHHLVLLHPACLLGNPDKHFVEVTLNNMIIMRILLIET